MQKAERGMPNAECSMQKGMQNAEDYHSSSSFIITVPPSSFTIASSLTEALQHGPFDIAIFALKSFDTAAAMDGMKPYADQLPPILCLSNGVDNEPAIAAVLGPNTSSPGP